MYPHNRTALVPLQLPLLTFVFGILFVECDAVYNICALDVLKKRGFHDILVYSTFYSI